MGRAVLKRRFFNEPSGIPTYERDFEYTLILKFFHHMNAMSLQMYLYIENICQLSVCPAP